ncbi:prolipoprotein diacylglyceryl transferase [Bifidobacterium pullorum subsp. saeculare]|uniref:Prolipoprotein diacylglyceryl transferase n=1 Tax=Bifidobacterium pullorum subsp. saeculare TaxID=78257 RepID=A0A938WZK6_9BIFI|nr:prolipoprotein diacylglyceryl transferase family protein [Bifidobacterium pullorum]MBM6700199.1 prolipoprotein diacylglyceryl transferase [Bifidobacterium pullorum subsp. saeculare]
MLPFVTVLGRTLPMYGVMCVAGMAAALLYVVWRAPRFHLSRDDAAYLTMGIVLGAVAGAKLLYILTQVPAIVGDLGLLAADSALFVRRYVSGGFVFYGGVAGGLAGGWIMCRVFGWRPADFVPLLAPAVPLAHAFGRIGCFCVGCCHGKEAPWGIAFTHAIAAPNGVPLIPVQLIEAGAEAVIFVILAVATARGLAGWSPLALFLALYAPVRFLDEFWRGDMVRGVEAGLSTSQWISLAAMAGVLAYALRALARRRAHAGR